MSTQVLEVLVRGRNETQGAFAELKREAQLSSEQIRALFNAGAAERGKLLADLNKTTETIRETKAEAQSFGNAAMDAFAMTATRTNEMAAAFSKGVSPVRELGEAGKQTHSQFDELGQAFATGLGIASFLTLAGALEKGLEAVKEVLSEAIFGTAKYAEENEIAAIKLGMTVEGAQRLKIAADINKSSIEQVTSALVQMERRVADNTDKAADALRRLNLSPEIFKDPEEAVLALSKALQEVPTHLERVQLGYALMGKGASNVMPVLMQDLEALNARSKELALTMSEDNVRAAAQFNQESELLDKTWDGLIHNFGAAIITDKNVTATLHDIATAVGLVSKAIQEGKPGLQAYFGFLADRVGLGQMQGALSQVLEFVRNLRNMGDQLPTQGTGWNPFAPAPGHEKDQERYFEETVAEQKAYLSAVMENQRIEEQQAKQHTSALKREQEEIRRINADAVREKNNQLAFDRKAAAEEDAIIKANTAEFIKDVRIRVQQEKEAYRELQDARRQVDADGREFMKSWKAQWEEFQHSLDNASGIADVIRGIGTELGGAFGSALESAAGTFQNFIERIRDGYFDIVEMAQTAYEIGQGGYQVGRGIGANGGSAGHGFLAGSAQGAATGAAIGTFIMPGYGTAIGAGVGAIAGGIGGLIGAKKGQKENQEAMEDLRKQLLLTFGGMDNLRKQSSLLGVDISRAFSTRDPKEFQRVVDELNQGIAEQKKRWEGIQTAVQGVDLLTKGLTETIKRHGEATDADRAAFQRLGDYAAATFGAMVKETGDVIGALQTMEPTLSVLADDIEQFGLTGSAALQELLGLRQIVIDNADIAQSIQGLNLLMKGFGEAGINTKGLFEGFGQDLAADFAELTARGADANQAMILMQPSLQSLWEHQQKFHDITDEATLALLDQAAAAGLVGEDQKSIYGQILDVLKDIRDTLLGLDGKTVNTNINVNTRYRTTGTPPPDPDHPGWRGPGWNYPDAGGGRDRDDDPDTPYAWGGYQPYVPGGQRAILGERTGETVIPDDYIGRLAQNIAAAGGGAAQPVVIQVVLDGRVLAEHRMASLRNNSYGERAYVRDTLARALPTR